MNISKFKAEIYKAILSGSVSEEIINKFIKDDNSVVAKECELWDYKEAFDGSDDSYIKTLKSIVSFYNTYGGYILYGVKEEKKDTIFKLNGIETDSIDQQKLRSRFDKYFGHRLDITYDVFDIDLAGNVIKVGLLHIPKRPIDQHSIAPIINGFSSKSKQLLCKDAVYYRSADECKQVLSHQDFEFIASERDFLSIQKNIISKRKSIIDHNLPDKSFICPIFIGRFEIIQELWSWLADEFQYAKVLAADGGKGKTSIAYEFCQLLAKSGTSLVEQIIWLTAKKKQFKAIDNSYISSPETHYYDLASLLKEICLRTGSLENEIEDYSYQQLQRTARANLQAYPSFIVIDDVDSNDTEEQRRISETARIIANTQSRVLLTTRANNIYSRDSCIEVPGLNGDDYKQLVNTLCDQLRLPRYKDANIKKIHSASEGSPLFTESILRLCKLGISIENAIKEWNGKSGESVREAALKKEVSELSQEAIKVLLTISYVDTCSRTELQQLTEMESAEISSAIEELGNLFLLQGLSFIEHEPRFETSSTIANLVMSISDEILPDASQYISRVQSIARGLKEIELTQGNIPEVGAAISQCTALLKENRYTDARETVSSLIEKPNLKENPDLYFMLARIEYRDPDSSGDDVRRLFSESYIKGQRKNVFFEMWFQAEKKYGNKSSIFDVSERVIKENKVDDIQWLERHIEASIDQASTIHNNTRKLELYAKAYEYAAKAMTQANSTQWRRLQKLSIQLMDLIWETAIQGRRYKIAGKAIINALKKGDIRAENYTRLITITRKVQNIADSDSRAEEQGFLDMREELESYIEQAVVDLKSHENKRQHLIDSLQEILLEQAVST